MLGVLGSCLPSRSEARMAIELTFWVPSFFRSFMIKFQTLLLQSPDYFTGNRIRDYRKQRATFGQAINL